MVQLLEELSSLVDILGTGENEQPLISEYYKEVTPLGHLIQSGNCPLASNHIYESFFYEAGVSFGEGRFTTRNLKKIHKIMITSKCFATDGSKMENKPFLGFP
jgi:hypothetical protein